MVDTVGEVGATETTRMSAGDACRRQTEDALTGIGEDDEEAIFDVSLGFVVDDDGCSWSDEEGGMRASRAGEAKGQRRAHLL